MVITRNQWHFRQWHSQSRERPPRHVGNHYLSVGLVLLLHLAAIYVLLVAVGVQHIVPPVLNLHVQQIAPPVARTDEIPLAAAQTPVFVPARETQTSVRLPDFSIQTVETSPQRASTLMPAETAPQQTAAAPVRVAARIDLVHSAKPPYPPLSRRLGEEGKVVLSVLVDPQGAVRDAKVETSSGFTRLDAAALDGVRHGYHFTAATENGRPVETWQRILVSFKLSDRD